MTKGQGETPQEKFDRMAAERTQVNGDGHWWSSDE